MISKKFREIFKRLPVWRKFEKFVEIRHFFVVCRGWSESGTVNRWQIGAFISRKLRLAGPGSPRDRSFVTWATLTRPFERDAGDGATDGKELSPPISASQFPSAGLGVARARVYLPRTSTSVYTRTFAYTIVIKVIVRIVASVFLPRPLLRPNYFLTPAIKGSEPAVELLEPAA